MIDLTQLPSRASSVYRWSGVPLICHRQNIAEHTFGVAYYALYLYQSCNLAETGLNKGDLLHYCLLHDLPEIVTSDIPSSVKAQLPELKELLTQIEERIYTEDLKVINMSPEATVQFVTKAADFLCILDEYNNEIRAGNRNTEFKKAESVMKGIYHKLVTGHAGRADQVVIYRVIKFIEATFNGIAPWNT